MQEQQGADASVDNEVMAILSSPVQQKKIVVKPQPRPGAGGAAAAAAGGPTGRALGPASPHSNGNASFVTSSSAGLGGEYLRDNVANSAGFRGGVGVGGTVDEVFGGGGATGGDAAGLAIAPSPPRTPGLPKSTSASWDPQVQSSSSAFSVPAGRGGGGGGGSGRVEGSGGAGGMVGGAGIGSLSLGGFRSVGGRHFQDNAPLSHQMASAEDRGGHRQVRGGGRTPGPRYPLEDSTLGYNAGAVVGEDTAGG
ncbi:unnamed protein product, partial [Scytosiphon promiscuus]